MSRRSSGGDEPRVRGERGSGTLLGVAVVLVLAMVAGGVLVVAGYVAAVHHARSAADLSALSGAVRQARGDGACRAAAAAATANGVRLVGCQVRGDSLDFVVSVTVEQGVRVPALLPQWVAASAHAGRLGLLQ